MDDFKTSMGCRLCQSQDLGPLLTAKDNLEIAPGSFQLVSCQNCGLVFVYPIPSSEEIRTYYPGNYCSRENLPPCRILATWSKKMENRLRNFLFQKEIRHLQKLISKGGRILDVGCGSGELLGLFKSSGYEVYGIELLPGLAHLAREKFGIEVRQGDFLAADYPADFFDLVIFYHVLEHLAAPDLGLTEAKRVLKKGGFLLLQFPNIASYQFRIFKSRWFALELPRHLYHFSPVTMELLLTKTGFEPFRIRHFSIRNNPLILASTLFPRLNYHRLSQPSAKVRFFSLLLALSLVPVTALEGLMGAGATLTLTARSL